MACGAEDGLVCGGYCVVIPGIRGGRIRCRNGGREGNPFDNLMNDKKRKVWGEKRWGGVALALLLVFGGGCEPPYREVKVRPLTPAEQEQINRTVQDIRDESYQRVMRDLLAGVWPEADTMATVGTTVEMVQGAVARRFGLEPAALVGRDNREKVVRARKWALYLSRELAVDNSWIAIGRQFGDRPQREVRQAHEEISQLIAAGNPAAVAAETEVLQLLGDHKLIATLENQVQANRRDPQNAQRLFALAYLYEDKLSRPQEAAALYQRAANDRRFAYANQALFRAWDILSAQANAAGPAEKTPLVRQANGLLSRLAMNLQRNPHAELWTKEKGDYVRIEEARVYVLKKLDETARHQLFYRVFDFLVGILGRRAGISYVLALILLAVLLKLVLHPIQRKQYESMTRMQELQPYVKELQNRYKGKPEKAQEMNREIMELYRQHKVNPLGGCLPMLIQMPVLFAVYAGIRGYAYQFLLGGQFLWIKLANDDLILLILYGISMFVQQRLMMMKSAPPTDPQQEQMQKMMQYMPLLFVYMMWQWHLPSAFYFYWMAFNVVSMVEQWYMTKKLRPQKREREGMALPAAGTSLKKPPEPGEPSSRKPSSTDGEAPRDPQLKVVARRARGRKGQRPVSVVQAKGKETQRKKRVGRRGGK